MQVSKNVITECILLLKWCYFCPGLTQVGTLVFTLGWVHLQGLCLLGVGQGYLVGVVTCFSGVSVLFSMEISCTTIGDCNVHSWG